MRCRPVHVKGNDRLLPHSMVGMAECVNILMELEGKKARFGHDKEADDLGVEIMEAINAFNNAHVNPYCEASCVVFCSTLSPF